jgi:hypothetical protein
VRDGEIVSDARVQIALRSDERAKVLGGPDRRIDDDRLRVVTLREPRRVVTAERAAHKREVLRVDASRLDPCAYIAHRLRRPVSELRHVEIAAEREALPQRAQSRGPSPIAAKS